MLCLLPNSTLAGGGHRHRSTDGTGTSPLSRLRRRRTSFSVSAAMNKLPFTPPPPSPPDKVYQPFRPPPASFLPEQYRRLDPAQRLQVLRDRLGRWHEYAPLVAALLRDGFNPPSIEEATGITGVEQNRLVVGAQVRDSLISTPNLPEEVISFFDAGGGADLLYELRFLNAAQRAAAAEHVVEQRLDSNGTRELARAMKDFPKRRPEEGWEYFDRESPADCLAFTRFRQSREAIADEDRAAELERALEVAATERAKERILREMEKAKKGKGEEEEEEAETASRAAVPVVRLQYGEVAEARSVVLLPVVKEKEGVRGMAGAPERCRTEGGGLGVVEADGAWQRWVVLPGWAPVMEVVEAGVALEIEDGRMLPWRSTASAEEKVLVVVDRRRTKVVEDGTYVVESEGRLVVRRGRQLAEQGVADAAATVVMVVRPPRDDDYVISDDEWD